MNVPQNSFKRALRARRPQFGLWSSLSSHYTVEVIAGAGFDWILLDSEHSPNDIENLLTQLQAAAPYPTHPVVRVPWNDMVNIKRVLDIGAQSLLVPYVSTKEEAADRRRHPPHPQGRQSARYPDPERGRRAPVARVRRPLRRRRVRRRHP